MLNLYTRHVHTVVYFSLFLDLLFLFLLGRRSSKKPQALSFQSRSGWNLAGLFYK